MPRLSSANNHLVADKFARLGSWYIIALCAVASVIVLGQVLIQNHLSRQVSDSHIVNVAGKQRMLSQKITKSILLLNQREPEARARTQHELKDALALWKVSQEGLIHGNDSLDLPGNNSDPVTALFDSVSVHFNRMQHHARAVVAALERDPDVPYEAMNADIQAVLTEEPAFLNGMENIVHQYDKEAQEKIARLSAMEYGLLVISLLLIAMEIIFIFRPTAAQVNRTMAGLMASERNSKKMANEIRELYASLEKSYEQISQINHPVENPRLYAKGDKGGNVTFVSPAFSELSGADAFAANARFSDLFAGMEHPGDWMDEVVDTVSEGHNWKGEVSFTGKGGKGCWVSVIITPVYNEDREVDELIVMGSDITRRKNAEQKINLKHQAEIDKRINQQKFRSVLILEGQEEERKRIAMDIHDGIGQMLTSLKYHVESINPEAREESRKKLKDIDALIKLLIREVRKVTFNLKPTVLGDYGLEAALNTFVREMDKLVDAKMVYLREGTVERLPQKVENNIFRIIQEAINNAIKYAEAGQIEVSLRQQDNEVVVEVKDDGKGFDTGIVASRSVNIESGRGLFNMYERTGYINGHLSIRSQRGTGTTVTLHVPVTTMAAVEE